MNLCFRAVLYLVSATLLAAAILALALRQGAGGGNGDVGRRAGRPPVAAGPSQRISTSPSSPVTPSPRSYPDQPFSTAGAEPAVRAFMAGFLPWSLGRAPARAIKNATAGFIADAEAHPPHVTPAEQHTHDRLLDVAIVHSHPPLAIVHVASSLGAPYTLTLDIVPTPHGWLATKLEPAG